MNIIPAITPLGQAEQRASAAWDQLYKEAASDFPTHEDFKKYRQELDIWMKSVNKELEKLTKVIASHTHTTTTPDGTFTSTPPGNKNLIVWGPTTYKLPLYLNTTGIQPNIKGTVDYKYRPITTTLPFIPSFVNPESMLAGAAL